MNKDKESLTCQWCIYEPRYKLIKVDGEYLCPNCSNIKIEKCNERESLHQQNHIGRINAFFGFVLNLSVTCTPEFYKFIGMKMDENFVDFTHRKTGIERHYLEISMTKAINYFPYTTQDLEKMDEFEKEIYEKRNKFLEGLKDE